MAPFADLARQFDLGPRDLDHVSIVKLLDKAPSVPKRDKMLRVLKLLKSYLHIKQVAQYLPDTIDIEAAQRRIKNVLPAHVDAWIGEVIEVGRLSNARFDKTTGKHSDAWEPTTVATYTSAMRRYVWSASKEHGGLIDLEALTDFSKLFTEEVALTVVADWNNRSETPNRMSARSAYEYISAIMTVLDRNDMDAEHLGEVRSNSAFLMQGKNATIEMSPKNIAFCRPIIESPHERRRFLTQHFAYRDRAEHILATDKTLTASQLREARMYGTCACFAAIELCGAPNRVSNVLQLRHRGPTANLFLPNRHADHYEIALVRNEMKVKKGKQVPRQKVRRNKLEGAQTLEWYLKTIRPLFQYGNPRWCAGDNQPLDNVRFGKVTDPSQRAESIYLFVANESASHLSKSRFYIYLCEASEAIGMPMTPHNYRHGVASILLKRSLANVSKVATMLNNTPAIVLQNYAWINEEAVIEETQGEIVEEAFQ